MLDLDEDELVEGSIPRALVVLAAPLVAQNLVHVLNQVVDTFWVGRLGETAVAAVGLNFPIVALLFAVVMMPRIGTQVLVSQRVGADDPGIARRIAFNGVILAAGVSGVLAIALGLNADLVVTTIGAGPQVGPLAAVYLGTLLLAFPLSGVGEAIESSFVGWGDTRAALYLNLATVLTNLALDPFLILGVGPVPRFGVQGAAMATGASYAAGFVVALVFALGLRDSFAFTRGSIVLRADHLRSVIDVGAPIAAQRLASQSVRVIIIGLVTVAGGPAGLAAYTVGARIASIAFIPAAGMQQAAQSMIGQNLGANHPARAERTVWVGVGIIVVGLTVVGVVQWLIPGPITTAFVPDLTVRGYRLTVQYLQILAYGYWALGATYLFLAGFNGASRTRTSFVVDVLKYWGVRLPIAVLAIPAGVSIGGLGIVVAPGVGLGVVAIFWAVTLSNVIAAVGVAGYYWYTSRNGMMVRAAERTGSPAD